METFANTAFTKFSRIRITHKTGENDVDHNGWNRAAVVVCGHFSYDGCDRSSWQPLPRAGRDFAVAGVGERRQSLPQKESPDSQRTSSEFARSLGRADRAEHEPLDGSGDRGHGGASRRCEIFVRFGIFQRDDRSHEHRNIPQSTNGCGCGGNQQSRSEGREQSRIYGKCVVFVGHDGTGIADRVSDGSRSHEEHHGQVGRDWEKSSQEAEEQDGENFRRGESNLYEDTFVHARQEGGRDSAEEEAVEGNATTGITVTAVGGDESGGIEWRRTREASADVGVFPFDVEANPALDADWISPSWKISEFVGEECASNHAEQVRQDHRVRASLVYYKTHARLYHRWCMQEVGERLGCAAGSGDFNALRKDDGKITKDVRLRSRRRWAEESQDIERKKNRERNLSQGEGVVDRIGTKHGSQDPPGARVVGGVDRDDQKFPLWIQQAPRENIGGVRPEGTRGDIGSEFSAVRKRLGGSRSGGVAKVAVIKRRTRDWMEKISRTL